MKEQMRPPSQLQATPSPALLRRHGIEPSAEDLAAYEQAVARERDSAKRRQNRLAQSVAQPQP